MNKVKICVDALPHLHESIHVNNNVFDEMFNVEWVIRRPITNESRTDGIPHMELVHTLYVHTVVAQRKNAREMYG